MPTNTSGGTTTSFANTPQARDDLFNGYEDAIEAFDVMANDLGGNAKILWSIDDTAADGSTDLLQQNVTNIPDCSELGAKIWIQNGRVYYDANALDWLAAGQSEVDHFTYAIRLANGTLSWATVTVNLVGRNDKVEITSTVHQGAAQEDGTAATGGIISFTDVDLADTHTASVVPAQGNSTTLGSFSLAPVNEAANAATGSVGWSYMLDNAAAQYLGAGEVVEENFVVTIDDGHGGAATQIVTVTITGTNDGPKVTAAVDSGAVSEDGVTQAAGTIAFEDVDLVDTHEVTVEADGNGYVGTFSVQLTDDSTGDGSGQLSWSFSVDNDLLQELGEDEELVQSYTVTIDDGEGGTVTQVVTVTITGVNDRPNVEVAVLDQSINEDNAWSFTVPAGTFDDVDGDALTVSATLADGTPLPSWLDFNVATQTFTGTPPQDFNGTIGLTVTASDGLASVSDTFDLVIAPVTTLPSRRTARHWATRTTARSPARWW